MNIVDIVNNDLSDHTDQARQLIYKYFKSFKILVNQLSCLVTQVSLYPLDSNTVKNPVT